MNDELAQFQPHIMAIFGSALQWLRQFSKFPEWATQIIAVGLAFGGYALFNAVLRGNPKVSIVYALVGISGNLIAVWGGTFGASNLAKSGVAVIPMTNSK
jgi:hypothetical protein